MSFRHYGGINYAAKNNVVRNNYSNVNNLSVMTKVGQPNTYINFESDISGNIQVYGDFDLSGNLNVAGDIDCSGNETIAKNLSVAGNIDCSGNLTINGDFDLSGNIVADYIFLSSGTNYTTAANGVVPKSYVDGISTGIHPTIQCQLATAATSNPISLSGYLTIDGITTQSGDRVLVNNQGYNGVTNVANVANGIYDASSGLWTRANDCSGNNVQGQSTFIQFGSTNSKSTFVQTASGAAPAIAGTDPLLYQKYSTLNLQLGQGLQFVNSNTIQMKSDLSTVPFITNLTVGSNTLYVNASTNRVGIGTDTPAYALSVINGTQISAGFGCNDTVDDGVIISSNINTTEIKINNAISTGSSGLGAHYTINNDSSGNFNILNTSSNSQPFTNGTSYFTIQNGTGYIGINNTNPSYRLDVNGTLRTTMDASINGLTVGKGGASLPTSTVLGNEAFKSNISGDHNTAVGYQSLNQNSDGMNNCSVGSQSLFNNTSGQGNTSMGKSSLYSNQKGIYNSSFGSGALQNTNGSSNNNGSFNTGVGYEAGKVNTSGTYNTYIGYNANCTTNNFTNSTAIGNGASVTASNQVHIGNTSVTSIGGYANWTNLSDIRDKKNIELLDAGLNFINILKPVRFDWNIRNGGKKDISEVGFIAQDLLKAQNNSGIQIPGLVNNQNPEQLFMASSCIIPILVKAVQEMSSTITRLESEINELKIKNL